MGRKIHKTEEIIQHLRTHDLNVGTGMSKEESARQIGVTLQTLNSWKREYGGLRVDQAKRLKELELENVRLKKIVANLTIDNSILKEVAEGNF